MRIFRTSISDRFRSGRQTTINFLLPALMTLISVSVDAQNPGAQKQTPPFNPAQWSSSLHTDHELAGQIWLAADNRFISQAELIAMISEADILLLGEKHDNPDHHRLRHGVLQSLLAGDTPALLVMEMITQTQQSAVDALSARESLPTPDSWPKLLAWDQAWSWAFYQPPISLALQTGTRLLAGNISTGRMMEIYRSDEATNPAADPALNAQQLVKLAEEINISHCGMLPESQIPAMVRVQQARDQQMASALMSPGVFSRRILLAGNYHIRHDLSVPNYLTAAAENATNQAGTVTSVQGLSLLNLAFLEVDPTLTLPADYLADSDGQPVFDLIWFTPAIRADDYCADMAP